MIIFSGCADDTSADQGREGDKPADTEEIRPSSKDRKVIVFFGNSLTAGYGLKPEQAYPALIQDRIDSLNYPYEVVNAGVSGETSAGGNSRVDWVLRQPVDIFVLELGGNDGLRGIPPEETRKNLQSIIDKVREQRPEAEIILAGMEAPPNMGQEFTAGFRQIYPELAAENDVALVPFLLEGVGGEPELNQTDGIHPNEEGAKRVAENVWEVLKKMLNSQVF
jgi:acyl-CoA thioesterase-1